MKRCLLIICFLQTGVCCAMQHGFSLLRPWSNSYRNASLYLSNAYTRGLAFAGSMLQSERVFDSADFLRMVTHDDFGIARYMMSQDARCTDATDADGNNALHWAMWFKDRDAVPRVSLVRSLCRAHVGCNKKNSRGQTPLHLALYVYKNMRLVQELIHAGADSSIVDNMGNCPILTLVAYHWRGIQSLAIRDCQPDFERALIDGNEDRALHFLAFNARPNEVDSCGGTALHTAAVGKMVRLTRALIAKGAAVERADQLGLTPLDTAFMVAEDNPVIPLLAEAIVWKCDLRKALEKQDEAQLRAVLATGVPMNMGVGWQGRSSFEYATRRSQKGGSSAAGYRKVAKWLALQGADTGGAANL